MHSDTDHKLFHTRRTSRNHLLSVALTRAADRVNRAWRYGEQDGFPGFISWPSNGLAPIPPGPQQWAVKPQGMPLRPQARPGGDPIPDRQRRHKAHNSLMSLLQRTDLANDNGKPEDHLTAAIAALHAAVKGLDAPVELLAGKIKAPVEGAP
jgi:hypothetical protein